MAHKLISELLELNRIQSELYAAQAPIRHAYREAHPTLVVAFKCMDGRVHLPVMTKTPFGLIRPKRNIGGVFDVGWPTERMRLLEITHYAHEEDRNCLFFVSYHFSKSDSHLGCAGHGYDTGKAITSSSKLVDDLQFAYRRFGLQENYAILVGVETDEEALVFHGRNGKTVSVAELGEMSETDVLALIKELYPDMPKRIALDLAPYIMGNHEHIKDVRERGKVNTDLEHRERVLAVGQGFDWLHKINYALINNDSDPKLEQVIGKAAGIILANRDKGNIPATGGLYFVSVPYFRTHQRESAVLHAKYLTTLGMETIRKTHDGNADFFLPLTAVMHWDTRRLEVLE